MKAVSVVTLCCLRQGKKSAFEHTKSTTAHCQLACAWNTRKWMVAVEHTEKLFWLMLNNGPMADRWFGVPFDSFV